jgi:hypothetical protein
MGGSKLSKKWDQDAEVTDPLVGPGLEREE